MVGTLGDHDLNSKPLGAHQSKPDEEDAEDRHESDGEVRDESTGSSGQPVPTQTMKRGCPEDTRDDDEEVKRARTSAERSQKVPKTTELRAEDVESL